MYKDDHEEEIAQSDGETVKTVMINEASTLLFTAKNLKAPSEGFWFEGNKDRVTRTDEIPNALFVEQIIDVPVPQIQEQRVEVQIVIPQERLQQHAVEQSGYVHIPQIAERIVEVVHRIPRERLPEGVVAQIVNRSGHTHSKRLRKSSNILNLTQHVTNAQDAKIVSKQDPAVSW